MIINRGYSDHFESFEDFVKGQVSLILIGKFSFLNHYFQLLDWIFYSLITYADLVYYFVVGRFNYRDRLAADYFGHFYFIRMSL